MNIELKKIKIREVVEGYTDDEENGVFGYGGRLNIRPAFQREFIYGAKERDEVIHTVRRGFPLNVMYWTINQDGNFELMDGQQRTISLCQFVNDDFSITIDNMQRTFSSLPADQREKILNYPLMIYFCEGEESERLEWFKIINIAGKELTPQELRNAIFSGEWTTAAKRYFSKNNCVAQQIGGKYLKGAAIRQDYLETAIEWRAAKDGQTIDEYMNAHFKDKNANPLKLYFQSVIDWIEATFPTYRKEMKGLEWGHFYNRLTDGQRDALDPTELEKQIAALMIDDDVTSKSGIYEYLLFGEEKKLAIRKFSPAMRRAAYERQKGKCPVCRKKFDIDDMDADHITPWSRGGKTTAENCQMLCKADNRAKGNK